MMLPKTRRNIKRVIPFGVLWFIFGLIYIMLEKAIIGNLDHYPSTGVDYNFARNSFVIPSSALMMGLLTGILEIGYFNKWFIKNSFTKKIIFKSFIYLVIVTVFLVIITFINTLYTLSVDSIKSLVSPAWSFFTDYAVVGIMVYIAAIIVITQLYAEFSQSIGVGALSNFFLGKYHHPVEEERIFMFLDMKSSTTIAENLGMSSIFKC